MSNETRSLIKHKVEHEIAIDETMALGVKNAVDRGAVSFAMRGVEPTKDIVDNVGNIAGELVDWNVHRYSPESIGYAIYMLSESDLTISEAKCAAYLVERDFFDSGDIERRETPDFVVDDDIGIEVKSNENYKISRKQLQSVSEYRPFHIFLSTKLDVRLLDVIDWIGLNEYRDV
jgi:hypothetical protein